ncbi:hypothetical protein HDU92_004951 [Lobulomyces angularis]|nr:hypothetical protein HDU92_004951 [Lobulomyces angularis]
MYKPKDNLTVGINEHLFSPLQKKERNNEVTERQRIKESNSNSSIFSSSEESNFQQFNRMENLNPKKKLHDSFVPTRPPGGFSSNIFGNDEHNTKAETVNKREPKAIIPLGKEESYNKSSIKLNSNKNHSSFTFFEKEGENESENKSRKEGKKLFEREKSNLNIAGAIRDEEDTLNNHKKVDNLASAFKSSISFGDDISSNPSFDKENNNIVPKKSLKKQFDQSKGNDLSDYSGYSSLEKEVKKLDPNSYSVAAGYSTGVYGRRNKSIFFYRPNL